MNPTREKALEYAMELVRRGRGKFDQDYILDMSRRFECYLDGTESHVESGADAEAAADSIGKREMDELVNGWEKTAVPFRIGDATPTPAANGAVVGTAPGAAATASGAEGRDPADPNSSSHATKEPKPRKPRKTKAKKAKRQKKVSGATDQGRGESPASEPGEPVAAAQEPEMDAAA